jgi:hypothetical protein
VFNPDHDPWTDSLSNRLKSSRRCPKCIATRVKLVYDEHAVYPPVPERPCDRIVGQFYMVKNQVRLWNGVHLYCKHDRPLYLCKDCYEGPRDKGESADKTHHHLLCEWSSNNEHPMSHYTYGSNKEFEWECFIDPTHSWTAPLCHRTAGYNKCPHCNPKRVLLVCDENAIYPPVPERPSDRVTGQFYMFEGQVRLWTGVYLHCKHDRVINVCDVCYQGPTEPADKTHPHLLSQWSSNNEHPMSHYTHGSNKEVEWECTANPDHSGWIASLNARTSKGGTGCPECYRDSRKHDPVTRQAIIDNPSGIVKPDGEAEEQFYAELLASLPCVKSVLHIGATLDKTDIIVTMHDDSERSVQVKRLGRVLERPGYYSFSLTDYVDDMLIVCVDEERKRFCAFFYHQIKGPKTMTLPFATMVSQYAYGMCSTDEAIREMLTKMLPHAAIYQEALSNTSRKEKLMWSRIEALCIHTGIPVRQNSKHCSSIDGWIGEKPVQLKFVSNPVNAKRNSFGVRMAKHAGWLNGDCIQKPYSVDDPFDYLVVELGGTFDEPGKHEGKFCVIPKQVLIDQGILSSPNVPSKIGINLCTPDYDREHWSKEYWDQFHDHFAPAIVPVPVPI